MFGQDYFKKSVQGLLSLTEQGVAAAQRHPNAKESRDELAKQITPSQIQEAQRLAREFKPKKEKSKK